MAKDHSLVLLDNQGPETEAKDNVPGQKCSLIQSWNFRAAKHRVFAVF